jgi:iron(III) transport system substrate-binding protein
MIAARLARSCTALIVLAVVLTACGSTAVRTAPTAKRANEKLDAIVAAARAEGRLVLSWPAGFLDAPGELADYTERFNKMYGLNLRVQFAAANAPSDTNARAMQSPSAVPVPATDVLLGTESEISQLAKTSTLVPELWSSWAPNVASLRLVAPGGVAVQVQSRVPGITYSSQRLVGADVPRTLADLLRAKYRGRIATTPTAATFDHLASPDIWGSERALEYVRKLSMQVGGLIDCGDERRIVNGDFDIFAFDCGSARVAQLKAEGALVGWSVPADAAFLRYLYMAVPKSAGHPNAARLWINFMVGREAQDVMYRYEYADHYLIPGSRSFAEVDRATKAGVKFYELTVEAAQSEEARGFKSAAPQIQSIIRESVPVRR